MVFSASSVYAFENSADSYAVVTKQLIWVAIGLPCAWVAGAAARSAWRTPARLARPDRVAGPAAAHRRCFGVDRVNGNTNWLALGPVPDPARRRSPSSRWCSGPPHVYANKDRRLGNLHQLHDAGGAGRAGRDRPGHASATTSAPHSCCSRSCSACCGSSARRRRLFAWRSWRSRSCRRLPGRDRPRAADPHHDLHRPVRDHARRGWQPAHGLFALSSGGWFGLGIGASQQKWGSLPEAHTDFIFAVIGEELGLVGTLLVLGAVRHHRLRRAPGRRRDQGPVRPLRLRHRGLDDRAGADQHRAWSSRCSRSSASRCRWCRTAARRSARAGRARHAAVGFARPRARGRARPAARRGPRLGVTPASVAGLSRAGPARGRGHGRPHLAAARHRRRPAPAATRVEITCLGTARGLEAQIVPAAGYPLELVPPRPAAAPPDADLLARARPAARRGGRAPTCSTGSGPTCSSASAASCPCRPTSPPAARTCRSSSTRPTRCPGSPTSSAPGSPPTSPPASRTPRCRHATLRRAADPPDVATLDRAALRGEARAALRAATPTCRRCWSPAARRAPRG